MVARDKGRVFGMMDMIFCCSSKKVHHTLLRHDGVTVGVENMNREGAKTSKRVNLVRPTCLDIYEIQDLNT